MFSYFRFSQQLNKDNRGSRRQPNDNVQTQNMHIRQTRIVEHFLEQMYHRDRRKSVHGQQHADASQIVLGRIRRNVKPNKDNDCEG